MSFKITAIVQAESGDFLSDFAARAGDYAGVRQITVVPEEAGEPVIDFVKNINGIKTFYVAHGEEIQFATLGAPSDARPMIDPAKWKVTGKSFNETPNAVASSKVSLSGSRWATSADPKAVVNTCAPKLTPARAVSEPTPVAIKSTPITTVAAPVITNQTSAIIPQALVITNKVAAPTSPPSNVVPVTRDNIIAAMLAANPKASSTALCVASSSAPSSPRSNLSGKAKSFVPSISSSPTASKVHNLQNDLDREVIEQPTASTIPVVQKSPNVSDTKAVRPPTNMVVARRIIGKSLGMNMAEKEDTRTQEMDSALKKTGGVEKEVKVVAEVTPEEKKSGIMAVGLGGSRWADPETRAKTKPRPIEDFYEEQFEAENKRIRYINEHLSLKFEPTPNAFQEKKVTPRAVSVSAASMTREQMYSAMRFAMVV